MLKALITTGMLAASLAAPALAEPLTRFDVVEDHTRFHFASSPVHEDGMPAYGNAFVTQGYIYPAGTLKEGVTGIHKDGSPAFPDLVLGTWTCDGWFVADGAHTKTGTWLISRQVYQFNDGDILISQGPENVDEGVALVRPITGATGDWVGFSGTIEQVYHGMNEFEGVVMKYHIPTERTDYDGYRHLAPGETSEKQG